MFWKIKFMESRRNRNQWLRITISATKSMHNVAASLQIPNVSITGICTNSSDLIGSQQRVSNNQKYQ